MVTDPEPGQMCLSALHAVILHGNADNPDRLVLHPAGCADDTCPVRWDLDEAGLDGLHPDYPSGSWNPGWTPPLGVYLVQQWAVAGTTSQYPLVPIEWDAGLTIHAHLPLTDPAAFDAANLEGHPWQ